MNSCMKVEKKRYSDLCTFFINSNGVKIEFYFSNNNYSLRDVTFCVFFHRQSHIFSVTKRFLRREHFFKMDRWTSAYRKWISFLPKKFLLVEIFLKKQRTRLPNNLDVRDG